MTWWLAFLPLERTICLNGLLGLQKTTPIAHSPSSVIAFQCHFKIEVLDLRFNPIEMVCYDIQLEKLCTNIQYQMLIPFGLVATSLIIKTELWPVKLWKRDQICQYIYNISRSSGFMPYCPSQICQFSTKMISLQESAIIIIIHVNYFCNRGRDSFKNLLLLLISICD